jgi:hypothetical protein
MMKDTHPKTAETQISRRALGHWALGGAAALVLSACGGGGGGDSPQSEESLRPAHDALESGMNRQDVIDVVGRPPDEDVPTALTWHANGETLIVEFVVGRNEEFIIGSLWIPPAPRMDTHNRQLV